MDERDSRRRSQCVGPAGGEEEKALLGGSGVGLYSTESVKNRRRPSSCVSSSSSSPASSEVSAEVSRISSSSSTSASSVSRYSFSAASSSRPAPLLRGGAGGAYRHGNSPPDCGEEEEEEQRGISDSDSMWSSEAGWTDLACGADGSVAVVPVVVVFVWARAFSRCLRRCESSAC
jgi:hypothetical protein